MTEEFTPSIKGFSENGRQLELEEGQFKDWVLARSEGKNVRGLQSLGGGINVVPESAGESHGFEVMRRYSLMSLQQTGKLQSSQYRALLRSPMADGVHRFTRNTNAFGWERSTRKKTLP